MHQIASILRNPAVRAGAVVGLPGALTMGLSAKAHTEATAEAEANPGLLKNRAAQAATGAQVLGDSIVLGAVLSASGVGLLLVSL